MRRYYRRTNAEARRAVSSTIMCPGAGRPDAPRGPVTAPRTRAGPVRVERRFAIARCTCHHSERADEDNVETESNLRLRRGGNSGDGCDSCHDATGSRRRRSARSNRQALGAATRTGCATDAPHAGTRWSGTTLASRASRWPGTAGDVPALDRVVFARRRQLPVHDGRDRSRQGIGNNDREGRPDSDANPVSGRQRHRHEHGSRRRCHAGAGDAAVADLQALRLRHRRTPPRADAVDRRFPARDVLAGGVHTGA